MIRLLDRAFDFWDLKEIPGEENNPTIMKFFAKMGMTWVQGDETSWCSAFINYLCIVEDYEHSGELTARSWLTKGTQIAEPFRGCLVVLWRESPSSWKGHVGLYIRETSSNIYVLGGNQSNRVRITPYPKERLLSYRILKQKKGTI